MKKRLISGLLTLCLLFSLFPATVYAGVSDVIDGTGLYLNLDSADPLYVGSTVTITASFMSGGAVIEGDALEEALSGPVDWDVQDIDKIREGDILDAGATAGGYHQSITFVAQAAGTASVSATVIINGRMYSADYDITVNRKAYNIEIIDPIGTHVFNSDEPLMIPLNVNYGELEEGDEVSWSVDDGYLASISQDGILTMTAAGTVVVTCKVGETVKTREITATAGDEVYEIEFVISNGTYQRYVAMLEEGASLSEALAGAGMTAANYGQKNGNIYLLKGWAKDDDWTEENLLPALPATATESAKYSACYEAYNIENLTFAVTGFAPGEDWTMTAGETLDLPELTITPDIDAVNAALGDAGYIGEWVVAGDAAEIEDGVLTAKYAGEADVYYLLAGVIWLRNTLTVTAPEGKVQARFSYNTGEEDPSWATSYVLTDSGTAPVPPDIPETFVKDGMIYTFTGWQPEIEAITETTQYTAQYEMVNISSLEILGIPDIDGEANLVTNETAEVSIPDNFMLDEEPITLAELFPTYGLTPTFVSSNSDIVSIETDNHDGTATIRANAAGSAGIRIIIGSAESASANVNVASQEGYGTVTFYADGESESVLVAVGDTPATTLNTDKAATETESYTFIGWEQQSTGEIVNTFAAIPDEAESSARNETYYAHWYTTPITRHVVFQNTDGLLLEEKDVQIGELPTIDTPSGYYNEENGYWYEFSNWSPTISTVKAQAAGEEPNIIYTAVYSATPLSMTATTVTINPLPVVSITAGDVITFTAQVSPSLETLGEELVWSVSDTSLGFINSSTGNLTALASGNIQVNATVGDTTASIAVNILNPDGQYTITYILPSGVVRYLVNEGAMPPDETLLDVSKPAEGRTMYRFTGWAPAIVPASVNALYEPQYEAVENTVTAIFKDWNGATLERDVIPIGSTPAYSDPDGLYRMPDATYAYTFTGWSPALSVITEDTTYTAQYAQTPREEAEYTLALDESISMYVGETATPVADSTPPGLAPETGLTWSTDDASVVEIDEETGEVTAVGEGSTQVHVTDGNSIASCTITVTDNSRSITWKNYDGTDLLQQTFPYGSTPVYGGQTPTRPSTSTYYYVFTGWSPNIVPVTENATYTAQFEQYEIPNIYLDLHSITIRVNETAVLGVDVDPDDSVLTWTSSNPTIATVDEYGNLVGVSTGTTTVTCSAGPSSDSIEVTVVAAYKYTITWVVNGIPYQTEATEGTIPVYDRPTPEKEADERFTYTFSGWRPALAEAEQDQTYTAQFDSTVRKYTVTFDDAYEGGRVTVQKYEYGEYITPPADPERPNSERKSYAFSAWDPVETITQPVTENQAYTARYIESNISYLVMQEGGEDAPESMELLLGTSLQLTADVYPTALASSIRWSSSDTSVATIDETGALRTRAKGSTVIKLETADGTMSDEMVVTVYKNRYPITFIVDGTPTVINVEEGDTPVFEGSTDKASDERYNYTFNGWDVEPIPAYSAATYTAQYTITDREYTITWVVDDTETTETYHYGDTPEYPDGEPEKENEGGTVFIFLGWDPEPEEVTGDATYTAQFADPTRQYIISWNVNGKIYNEVYNHGDTPTFKGSTDREPSKTTIYTFSGWGKEIVPVEEATSYIAQYTETAREYTITWVVNGTSTTEKYLYNQMPTYKGTPEKASTTSSTYRFTGWDKNVVKVTADATYTAQFSEVKRQYTITFKNYDNSTLYTGTYSYGETPTYPKTTPTRPSVTTGTGTSAKTVTYTFIGWDPVLAAVTKDETYVAQYRASDGSTVGSKFTITFVDWDGTELAKTKTAYGEIPVYPKETPTRASTSSTRYAFDRWSPTLKEAYEAATYKATYRKLSATEYILTEAELTEAAKAGGVHTYDFPAGTLCATAQAIADLQELKGDIDITVTESGGIVTVTVKKGSRTITDGIRGLTFFAENIYGCDTVAVASGTSAFFQTEVFSAVTRGGSYVQIPGTCQIKASNSARVFTDVNSGTSGYSDIQSVVARGLMVGTDNNEFNPEGNVTRAEVVQTLCRLLDTPRFQGGTAYNDVLPEDWFAKAVFWSSANSIMAADGRNFNPNSACKREDIVAAMYNTAKVLGLNPTTEAKLGTYHDVGNISSAKISAFRWAVGENIITGLSSVQLAPQGYAERSQMAAFLNRFVRYIVLTQIGEDPNL